MWKYRFYLITLVGLLILFIGAKYCRLNLGVLVWGIGLCISLVGVMLQIIIAPNFKKNDNSEIIYSYRKSKKHCPNCGRKGYPTTLIAGKSFACKTVRCSTWWVN